MIQYILENALEVQQQQGAGVWIISLNDEVNYIPADQFELEDAMLSRLMSKCDFNRKVIICLERQGENIVCQFTL